MEELMKQYCTEKVCKYCEEPLKIIEDEGIECEVCSHSVHLRCLRRGAIPGGFTGDVFFNYKCEFCSGTETEHFSRSKMSWYVLLII